MKNRKIQRKGEKIFLSYCLLRLPVIHGISNCCMTIDTVLDYAYFAVMMETGQKQKVLTIVATAAWLHAGLRKQLVPQINNSIDHKIGLSTQNLAVGAVISYKEIEFMALSSHHAYLSTAFNF